MNNVLDVKGYRFFQASYDQDEQGTVLSVNRDVAGRTITYTGYAKESDLCSFLNTSDEKVLTGSTRPLPD